MSSNWTRIVSAGIVGLLFVLSRPPDLRQLSFPLALALDFAPQANNPYGFNLTAPVAVTPLVYAGGETEAAAVSAGSAGVGYGAWQYLQHMGAQDRNLISLDMLQMLLIESELLRRGYQLDYFFRAPKGNQKTLLAVTTNQASVLLLETQTPSLGGEFLLPLLKYGSRRGFLPVCTLQTFRMNQFDGKNPIAPLLAVEDGQAQIVGAAIFKRDQLIETIGLAQSQDLILLRGQAARGTLSFQLEEGMSGAVEVANRRQVSVTSPEPGRYDFALHVVLRGSVTHLTRPAGTSVSLDQVERSLEQDLRQDMERFVRWMQQDLKADCIDISRYAMAKWKTDLADKIYDETFIGQASIRVSVDVQLKNYGELDL
jgi:hypothetical protein